MRQTTQAVALLLTIANAATTVEPTPTNAAAGFSDATTALNGADVITQADQAQSRTSSYVNANYNTLLWTFSGPTYAKNTVAAVDASPVLKIASSGCMQCLNGGGVWCSRTFSFMVNNAGSQGYQSESAVTAGNLSAAIPASMAATQAGTYDNGSCCASQVNFATYVGVTGTAAAFSLTYPTGTASGASNESGGQIMTQYGCVATSTTPSGGASYAFGAVSWDRADTAYTSWWCSNGLYKKNYAAGGSTPTNGLSNLVQILNASSNPRKELAQVACPNKSTLCGVTQGETGYTLLDSSTLTKVYTISSSTTLTTTDKCTWVVGSTNYAPTFKLSEGSASLGITSDNWQLHTMEYTTAPAASTFAPVDGSLVTSYTNTGFQTAQTGLGYANYVPRFDMPANQFNTLRTWYGYTLQGQVGTVQSTTVYKNQLSSWFSSGQNGTSYAKATNLLAINQSQQFYGNVAQIGISKYNSSTTAAPAGSNYGAINSVKFDFRTVRYVPASKVQATYQAGQDLATAFNAKYTSYNTAKTVWNNYVAILSKNAKMDAFAAAFSPPKAPTVPPLPNMPWVPATYTGGLKQTNSQAALQALNIGSAVVFQEAAQPASNTFWTSLDAAQSIGGWGSFTAQIMTYRAGFGKSFGTIGFSADATMSSVWNNNWMCSSTTAAGSQSNTSACAQNTFAAQTGTAAAPVLGALTDTAANTQIFISVVSLWSLGNTNSIVGGTTAADAVAAAAWATKSDLTLTFTASAWSSTLPALTSATPLTYTGTPSAADSLSGIAGAQALAASSAAVLALAALY